MIRLRQIYQKSLLYRRLGEDVTIALFPNKQGVTMEIILICYIGNKTRCNCSCRCGL